MRVAINKRRESRAKMREVATGIGHGTRHPARQSGSVYGRWKERRTKG